MQTDRYAVLRSSASTRPETIYTGDLISAFNLLKAFAAAAKADVVKTETEIFYEVPRSPEKTKYSIVYAAE